MYPDQSNFRLSTPGAAWFILGHAPPESSELGGAVPPDTTTPWQILTGSLPSMSENKGLFDRALLGERVVVSQWDAIVRRFQQNAKRMLGAGWSMDLAGRNCMGGTPHGVDDLRTDGVWDRTTGEALVALACRTAQQAVAPLASVLPSLTSPEFPESVVRAVLAYAFVITRIGTPDAPVMDPNEAETLRGLRLPSNVVLPSLASPVQSDSADAGWSAAYSPSTEAAPKPPSASGRSGVLGGALLLAGAVGVGYLVWTAFADSSAPRR